MARPSLCSRPRCDNASSSQTSDLAGFWHLRSLSRGLERLETPWKKWSSLRISFPLRVEHKMFACFKPPTSLPSNRICPKSACPCAPQWKVSISAKWDWSKQAKRKTYQFTRFVSIVIIHTHTHLGHPRSDSCFDWVAINFSTPEYLRICLGNRDPRVVGAPGIKFGIA